MIKNEFDWYIQFNKMQNLNDMIAFLFVREESITTDGNILMVTSM